MRKLLLSFSILSFTLAVPAVSRADSGKEFAMSCMYGVLAGTLVGAASLAFTSQPGENLNNIARGASLGLYSGIILGIYVVYGVPSGDENPSKEETPTEETPADQGSWMPKMLPIFAQNSTGAEFIWNWKF